ncbi:MAG: anti-sigma factor [Acetobacteraceae bacterium]
MDCDRAAPRLAGFIDRELPSWSRFRLARHLKTCPACGEKMEELQVMRTALHNLPYHRAPLGLAARIVASLPREAPVQPSRPWFRVPAFALTGTGMAGALAGVALMVLVSGVGRMPGESTTEAVVDSHIASMMANHLTDVPTSDHHTVKPWLSARVDVSPPVRDLAAEGFTLIGGRLDYIDGHPAASVVYRRDKHVINLFAWASPGEPDKAFHTTSRQGYNVVTWRTGGVTFFAVSDVEADQLAAFARLEAAT